MNVGALFSGGKDSVFAVYWAIQQAWDVRCLVTLVSDNPESYMFHTPNVELTRMQSKAIGIPQILHKTRGEKEKELEDLKAALCKAKTEYNITGLMVGAIASDYQQERVNRICEEIGLKTFAPLWHKRQGLLLQEMIECGFEIIIQSIAAEGLDKRWLGRIIDQRCYSDLERLHRRIDLHIAGEGGEFESFVLDGPIFRKRLAIVKSDMVMESNCIGYLKIFEIQLLPKTGTKTGDTLFKSSKQP